MRGPVRYGNRASSLDGYTNLAGWNGIAVGWTTLMPTCSSAVLAFPYQDRMPVNGALMMNPTLSENGNLIAQADSAVSTSPPRGGDPLPTLLNATSGHRDISNGGPRHPDRVLPSHFIASVYYQTGLPTRIHPSLIVLRRRVRKVQCTQSRLRVPDRPHMNTTGANRNHRSSSTD